MIWTLLKTGACKILVSGGGYWINDAVSFFFFFTCFAAKNIKEFPYCNKNYSWGGFKIQILCRDAPVGFNAHVEILALDGNISNSFILKGKQRKNLIILTVSRYERFLLIVYISSVTLEAKLTEDWKEGLEN